MFIAQFLFAKYVFTISDQLLFFTSRNSCNENKFMRIDNNSKWNKCIKMLLLIVNSKKKPNKYSNICEKFHGVNEFN